MCFFSDVVDMYKLIFVPVIRLYTDVPIIIQLFMENKHHTPRRKNSNETQKCRCCLLWKDRLTFYSSITSFHINCYLLSIRAPLRPSPITWSLFPKKTACGRYHLRLHNHTWWDEATFILLLVKPLYHNVCKLII